MVWSPNVPSPIPPEVTALRDMLLLVQAWNNWNAGIHYPQAALAIEHGVQDSFPLGVIVPDESTSTPYAAGAPGLRSGRLTLILYDAADNSNIETVARSIKDGLCALYVGLPNLRGTVGLCSDPTPGQRAAADGGTVNAFYRSISISFSFGLRP